MKRFILVLSLGFFLNPVFSQTGKTLESIPLPTNYERVSLGSDTFGAYLRALTLKSNNIVLLYNGTPKANQNAQYGVLTVDVGTRDLQQCADAYMRLEAEWLYSQKRFGEISYNFTSGHPAKYTQWSKGFRPQVSGSKVSWSKIAEPDSSYKSFRKYLDVVFTYAGTSSLNKELSPVNPSSKISPGDVFIQSRNPYGHAVIVADVAKNKTTGEIIFLLLQSYMPAQEIHVLKNPRDAAFSPWYSLKDIDPLVTPEWVFNSTDLKRRS